MKKLIQSTLLLSGLMIAPPAFASEGSVYGGPIGGTDIGSAYLPASPGLYGGVADVDGYSYQLDGNNGQKEVGVHDVNFNVEIMALGLQYVYPVKLFGGTLASYMQVGYSPSGTFSINHNPKNFQGWFDPYVDLLKWSKYIGPLGSQIPAGAPKLPYGLTVFGAYSMILPTGTYQSYKYTSTGHNDVFIIPSVAATYLSNPNFLGDGMEVSSRLFADYSLENPKTHYKSGTVIDCDFAVSERHGPIQYGVAGFFADQIDDDDKNGLLVQPDGKHYAYIKLGPVIAYRIPHTSVAIKFKATFPLYAQNTLRGPQFVLSAGFKF